MKQTVHSSPTGLGGCAIGCSEQGQHLLKNHQQHWNLWHSWSLQGGLSSCNTPVQAPGSNPTVPSTSTEPHRSYSSLVAAQTSACLSRMPEFPGASRHSLQQPLSLGNCCLFLLGPPQLPAPTLSCSQHVLFIQLETSSQQAGTGLPLVPVSLAHDPIALGRNHHPCVTPRAVPQQQGYSSK